MKKENHDLTNDKHYFLKLIIVLTIVYIVDEIASNMNSSMQPYVLIDLFKIPGGNVLSPEYAKAVSTATILSIPGYCFMFLTPFYKALADKWGRKLFLIINTTMMGAGLLVCFLAPNYYLYVVGVMMVTFVQTNDMQVMYIMETAPEQHRAKLCSITKAIALAGVSLIGVCRKYFYDPSVISSWRYVFIIPAILGIAVGLGSIPFVKETPVFLKHKNELQENKEAKKEKGSQGGVIEAFKYIWKNKQMRSICFAGFVFCLATGITAYYTTITAAANSAGVLSNADIDLFMIVYPFINAAVTFVSGFFSDKLGRKMASVLLSGIAAVGLLIFILGARLGWGGLTIALGYGIFIGGLWSVSDTVVLVMTGESTPTHLRASVIGTNSMISGLGSLAGIILMVVGMNIVGSGNVGLLSLATTLPFMILAMIMLMRNVKETNGTDLSSMEDL
ncbi:MAG: MFS transporter [Erysipelotrichaceae bacterium]|nr:MFS transporter [Erysipelotrichaceae bacterium]